MNKLIFAAHTIGKIFFRFSVKSFLFAAFLFFCVVPSSQTATAQELGAGEIAPPPLKIFSKEERKQLDETPDLKKRTVLALAMMEARIKKAESLDAQNQFDQMYQELGAFHALVDYTLNFLYRSNNGNSKNLSNFKRFEIGLRTFPARIEVIRRELPIKYESYLSLLLKFIRDTRSKAVEPFFSDSVIRQRNNQPNNQP